MKSSLGVSSVSVLFGSWCWLISSVASAAMPYDLDFTGDAPPAPPAGYLAQADTDDPVDAAILPGTCEPGCSCCCCCWEAWANALFLSRSGGGGMSLAYGDPGDPKGTEVFNSDDLHFGYGWGPHVGVARCLDCCSSIGVEFFAIDGWSTEAQIAGNISVQFPSFPYLPELVNPSDPHSGFGVATFRYTSSLYNAEVNYRRRVSSTSCVTALAGFRWIELNERFGTVFETGGTTPNFAIDTNNHLYGFQVGALANIPGRGPWFFDGWLKAGVYGNVADQATHEDFTSAGGSMTYVRARDTSMAFAGDVGIAVGRRITDRLSARLGYMAMWVDGVALAPEQLDNSDPSSATASLDNSGGIFYHGGFAGLEYLW